MRTVDRWTALAGVAAAVGGLHPFNGVAATLGVKSPASPLGHWSADADGLPCYVFTGDVPVKTTTPSGRVYPLDPDPVFLLGNYDLTLFAFASGRLLFVSGERGWVRLNQPTAATPGHAASLTVTSSGTSRTYELLGQDGVCASSERATRAFGCGTARYRLIPETGLTVERILSVAPSTATERAQPAVVVTVRLTNAGPAPLDIEHL